jgi:hypothetical protein
VLNARRGSFSASDEEYLKRLAAEAALAVENTSLYALVRPRRRGAAPALPVRYRYNRIVGESAAMQSVYALTKKAAATDATVLLRGESGTGKELIARAIHYNSRRAGERFVVQNCSAFNDNLLDSELFGHKKGAFTGAIADKQGLFGYAIIRIDAEGIHLADEATGLMGEMLFGRLGVPAPRDGADVNSLTDNPALNWALLQEFIVTYRSQLVFQRLYSPARP